MAEEEVPYPAGKTLLFISGKMRVHELHCEHQEIKDLSNDLESKQDRAHFTSDSPN
jgi:hypothetical protein